MNADVVSVFKESLRDNPEAVQNLPAETRRRLLNGDIPKRLVWLLKEERLLKTICEKLSALSDQS